MENLINEQKPKYSHRPSELFEDILLVCNGNSYQDIKVALEKAQQIILTKCILSFDTTDIK